MIATGLRMAPLLMALAGGVGGDIFLADAPPAAPREASWSEVKWPFPLDQWGTGRAFRCMADACGLTVSLYLRPKVGFCNCAKGVYDDAELDRVGDMELIGPQFTGLDAGRPVTVGWMNGRSRTFNIAGPYQPRATAVAIAFNDRCDVMVATVIASADPTKAQQEALKFLSGELVLRWARAELGSGGS